MKYIVLLLFLLMAACSKETKTNNDMSQVVATNNSIKVNTDPNLLQVGTIQYYLHAKVKTLFPKEKFYTFRIGQSKEDVIKYFGESYIEHGYNDSDMHCIYYVTNSAGILYVSKSYRWEFIYDNTGKVIEKGVYEDHS